MINETEQPNPPHPRDCDATICTYPRCRRRLQHLYNNNVDLGGGWPNARVRRLRALHVRRHTQRHTQPTSYKDFEPDVVDNRWLIVASQPSQLGRHIPTPLHPDTPPIPDLSVDGNEDNIPPWVRFTRHPRTQPPQHLEADKSPHFAENTPPRPRATHPQHIHLTAMEVGQRPLGPTPEWRVCLTASADIAFDPCHHVVCCGTCTRKLNNQRCPICRQEVARGFRVYF